MSGDDRERPGTGGVDVSDRYSAKSAGRAETARLCVSTVGPSRDPDVATTHNLRGGIFESMPADVRARRARTAGRRKRGVLVRSSCAVSRARNETRTRDFT